MKAQALLFLSLVALLIVAPGCSLMAPSMQMISINASDARADIFVDGAHVGRGTATARVKRDEPHTVTARVGDRIGSANIGTSISGLGVLDLIGGFIWLVPFLGVTGSGFHKLDRTTISVVIPPGAPGQ